MKQQSKGQGTISHDKARESYRAYYVTPAGRRISKRFKTKKEAADWLAQQQTTVNNGSFTEPSNITLGSWLLTWLKDYKKAQVSTRTMELYTALAEKCEPIAAIKLQQVTPPAVQTLYNDLLQKISGSTVNKLHKMLGAAFKKARQVNLISVNPMEAVESPKFEYNHDIKTFTKEEVSKLYEAAKEYVGGRYYPLILLALTTGMRRGELLALRWKDIDANRNEIFVTRNLTETKQGQIIIGPPKTKAGRRKVAVPAKVISELKASLGGTKTASLETVFCTAKGTPLSPSNLERQWRQLFKHTDVPYRNFHVLRHTHCTDLLAAGVPIIEVARRVGHARVSHTLELYGHAIPSYDKEIADKVGNLYIVK